MWFTAAIFLATLHFGASYQQWRSIYHKITQDPEFSGFYQMIKSDRIAVLNLLYSSVTIFVPENDAIDNFSGRFPHALVLYHMGVEARTLKLLALNNTLDTVNVENPPLWVTVSDGYYVNNAKIIEGRSNYLAKSKGDLNKNQVLHVVDSVLDPMTPSLFPNPTAYDFLNHYHTWNVSNFLTRVQFHKKEDLFMKRGGHTFFIPVDNKMDNYQMKNIDSYIIEGHVIPNYVLFTRPTEKNLVFETAANGEYVFIVASFAVINQIIHVKSYTVLGNSQHKKGEIIAKIVKANIPVSNGVVHLIARPLGVFEPELTPFPYLPVLYKISSDPFLNFTYGFGAKGKVNRVLTYPAAMITYFAPRNAAWGGFERYSKREIEDILGRHLVVSNGRFSMARLAVLSKNTDGPILNTISGPVKFKVMQANGRFFVEWNDKRVMVTRSDYECSDGIVHVVDGIFGEPLTPSQRHERESSFWGMLKNLVT